MEQSIKDIIKTIESSISEFQDKVPGMQKKIFDELLPMIKKLDLQDGNILNRVDNLKLIGDIKNKLKRLLLSDEYKKAVKNYMDGFNMVAKLQQSYFSAFNQKYKPKNTLPIIRDLAVESTVTDLMGQGYTETVAGAITEILRSNITTGGSYASLQEQLRNHILTNDTGDGNIERYTRQITTDAINQFNAQYHDAMAQDLGFNWGRYVGSNLTTTREFCLLLTKKQWVHRSELPSIIEGKIDGNECKLSKSTGLPLGMIPGTDPANFKIRRGGYNCGHQFFWVPDSAVPASIKSSFIKSANSQIPESSRLFIKDTLREKLINEVKENTHDKITFLNNGGVHAVHKKADKGLDFTESQISAKLYAELFDAVATVAEHSKIPGKKNPELNVNGFKLDNKIPNHSVKNAGSVPYKNIVSPITNGIRSAIGQDAIPVVVLEKRYNVDDVIKGVRLGFEYTEKGTGKQVSEIHLRYRQESITIVTRYSFLSGDYVKKIRDGYKPPLK